MLIGQDPGRPETQLAFFERQVHQYSKRLHAMVLRMVGRGDEAADLTQEILLRAWTQLGKFRGASSFYTWIYRIAVNMTLNHLKRRRPVLDPLEGAALKAPGGPERSLEDAELRARIEQAILRLSESLRVVFVMREVQGMSFEEIAAVLECREDAVRMRLSRARRQLQEMLAPYWGGDT